jgi:hypothetical protein
LQMKTSLVSLLHKSPTWAMWTGRCRHKYPTSLVPCLWSTDIHQIVSSTDQHYRSFQYSPSWGLPCPSSQFSAVQIQISIT